jgi:hypothetical protein
MRRCQRIVFVVDGAEFSDVSSRPAPREVAPMLWTILTLAFFVASDAALAASHHVYPGPNALQTAIDGAAAGDRLLVHPSPGGYGVYAEAVTVDKPLQIIGTGVVVTGDCTGSIPMTIAADGVRIRRISFTGASGPYAIDVQDRDDVRLEHVWAGNGHPAAGYPTCVPTVALVNLERSTNVRVRRNIFYVESPPPGTLGIRLAEIASGAAVSIVKTGASVGVGVLIVDSGAGALLGAADILVRAGGYGDFSLQNSDGVRILNCSAGVLSLDATSDNNFIVGNSLFQAVDNGTGNCWRGNYVYFGTAPGCP